jgi:hypothetical protein
MKIDSGAALNVMSLEELKKTQIFRVFAQTNQYAFDFVWWESHYCSDSSSYIKYILPWLDSFCNISNY